MRRGTQPAKLWAGRLQRPTGSFLGSDACGDPSSGGTGKVQSTGHGSTKQEAVRHSSRPKPAK